MIKSAFLFLLLTTTFALMANDIEPDPCASPEICFDRMYRVFDYSARPGSYPSDPEEAVIKKLLSFGDKAMPFIIKLLNDKDPLVARTGAVALRSMDFISPEYLPDIVNGLDNKVAWLAPALAGVGTDEAAAIAVERLLEKGSGRNQESIAVERFGLHAVPAMMQALICEVNCVDSRFLILSEVFKSLDTGKEDIAIELIEIAKDESKSAEIRTGVLQVISALGEQAVIIEDDLVSLMSVPELGYMSQAALLGVKSKHAAKFLEQAIKYEQGLWAFHEIAALGTKGKVAGETLISLLKSPNLEVKLKAARTLGYIEFKPAVYHLEALLDKQEDVLVDFVATESLGRIGDKSAHASLQKTAKSHWHPAVRASAQKAIANIDSEKAAAYQNQNGSVWFNFNAYTNMDIKPCSSIRLEKIIEPQEVKLYTTHAQEALKALAYPSTGLDYAGEQEFIPDIALKTDDGWLVGSDRGEWGGELLFISNTGMKNQIVLQQNIEDIYFFGNHFIALTGVAHMMNKGQIYRLSKDYKGLWQAELWQNLPGSPMTSWLVETGELLINTYNGGSLLLGPDGNFRMAECERK